MHMLNVSRSLHVPADMMQETAEFLSQIEQAHVLRPQPSLHGGSTTDTKLAYLLLLAAPLQPHCQLLPLHHRCFLGLPQLCCLIFSKVQLQRRLLTQLLRLPQLLLQLLRPVCRRNSNA